jgi:hypothetical protein
MAHQPFGRTASTFKWTSQWNSISLNSIQKQDAIIDIEDKFLPTFILAVIKNQGNRLVTTYNAIYTGFGTNITDTTYNQIITFTYLKGSKCSSVTLYNQLHRCKTYDTLIMMLGNLLQFWSLSKSLTTYLPQGTYPLFNRNNVSNFLMLPKKLQKKLQLPKLTVTRLNHQDEHHTFT